MDSVFATEKASLVNNIALIDGFTRSGKFFLAKIVSGLNKIEFFQYIHVIEQLPYIYRLGGVTEDAAIALLRSAVDRHAYDVCFGRHLNLRHEDDSSIFNAPDSNNYFIRAFKKYERKEIVEMLQSKERVFLFARFNRVFYRSLRLFSRPRLVFLAGRKKKGVPVLLGFITGFQCFSVRFFV